MDELLNAVVVRRFERALAEADEVTCGPFAGVPYLLKDLVVEIDGELFQEGSRFLAGYRSPYTSELVHRLRRAGLIVIGRTNAPEFGMVLQVHAVAADVDQPPRGRLSRAVRCLSHRLQTAADGDQGEHGEEVPRD